MKKINVDYVTELLSRAVPGTTLAHVTIFFFTFLGMKYT